MTAKGFKARAPNQAGQTAMDTGKRHLTSLDSLRGIGVILIFADHFILPNYYIFFGWIGLWIFFSLSGFLITDSLLKLKTLSIGSYFGRFYLKRAFRILPAFLVFFSIGLALYFTLPRWLAGNSDLSRYWIYIVTFTFNHYPATPSYWFGHLWSLSLEEQFYVVWPWLVFFLSKNWFKRIVLCWILAAPILRLIFPWFYGSSEADMMDGSLLCQADAFAIGGCVAIFRDEMPGPRRSKMLMWIMTLAVILIGLVCYFRGQHVIVEGLRAWTGRPQSTAAAYFRTLGWVRILNHQYVWGYSVINIWAATLILACLRGTAPLFLNFPPLVFLGRISYGAYLSHMPLLGIYLYYFHPIDPFSIRGFMIFLVWFATVILVSWLSFRFIEVPFLRLKNSLGERKRVPTQPPLEFPSVKPALDE
jgi:peptidoglycan/LPS O-acetylase OafA/YrhL